MILFHRFLIGTAILFCAGFALWAIGLARATGGVAGYALGGAFAIAACALAYYLRHLRRFLYR